MTQIPQDLLSLKVIYYNL